MREPIPDLFVPPAGNAAQPWMYRQGEVITFDPVTLANTVKVGDSILSDLEILGVGEATLLTPGSVVGIAAIGGDPVKYAIQGRLVTPGTSQAADAVSLLNSQVKSQQIAVQETCTSTTFGDLTTVGPEVEVVVGPSGRLLIICTSQIQWISAAATATTYGGWVSVDISGANTISAGAASAQLLPTFNVSSTITAAHQIAYAVQVSATAQAVFEGLNTGRTIIRMKYANQIATFNADFGRRTLTVIKL